MDMMHANGARIMNLSVEQWTDVIRKVSPRAKAKIVDGLAAEMPGIVDQYGIDSIRLQSHFLAQCAKESDGFTTTVEYASGDAYDTRVDMGVTAAKDGDGRKFKGFGVIQTTGPKNQRKAAIALNILKEWQKRPSILSEFPWAARSAGIFWRDNRINEIAGSDDLAAVKPVTRKVNGGTNGLEDRKTYFKKANTALVQAYEHVPGKDTLGLPDPIPREKVRAVQQRLDDLGYHMVGTIDGRVGANTKAAIAAFQHDNEIAISGEVDAATEAALWTADKRALPVARTVGEPLHNRVLKHIRRIKTAAAGGAAASGAAFMSDPLGSIEITKGFADRVKGALEPFHDLLATYWPLAVGAVCVALFISSKAAESARVKEHQEGQAA